MDFVLEIKEHFNIDKIILMTEITKKQKKMKSDRDVRICLCIKI